ncbi:siphovirus Gp157 family protein [Devosia sp.]|uniref:siphovirus Gp157 family protein n=1 Tax=Devosia sp. TaxID=1871048 RepID=UPI002FC8CC29
MGALHELTETARETQALAVRIRELCGEDDTAFLDTLDGECDAVEAARRVVRWILEQGASADAVRGLAATYTARAGVYDERIAGAKLALLRYLDMLGVKSMPLPEATLSVRAGTPKLVGEPDPAFLPDKLVRITRAPDKVLIKQMLQQGEAVDGFTLSNGEPTLAVRVR